MKYQLNPIIVEAAKVVGVGEHLSDGSIRVLLGDEGPRSHGTVVKRGEMAALPKVGDYFVTHEDGSRNLVPSAAFEATHSPVASDDPQESADSQQDAEKDHLEAGAGDEESPEATEVDAETEFNPEN